jgi:hypothetical protein
LANCATNSAASTLRGLHWNVELAADRLSNAIERPSFGGGVPDHRADTICRKNGSPADVDQHDTFAMQGCLDIRSDPESQKSVVRITWRRLPASNSKKT